MVPPPAMTDQTGVMSTGTSFASAPTATNCWVEVTAIVTSGVTVIEKSAPGSLSPWTSQATEKTTAHESASTILVKRPGSVRALEARLLVGLVITLLELLWCECRCMCCFATPPIVPGDHRQRVYRPAQRRPIAQSAENRGIPGRMRGPATHSHERTRAPHAADRHDTATPPGRGSERVGPWRGEGVRKAQSGRAGGAEVLSGGGWCPALGHGEGGGEDETRLQLGQRRLEPMIRFAVLFGTVGHDQEVGDLLFVQEPGLEGVRARLGPGVLTVEQRLHRRQPGLRLGGDDLVGVRPHRLGRRILRHRTR